MNEPILVQIRPRITQKRDPLTEQDWSKVHQIISEALLDLSLHVIWATGDLDLLLIKDVSRLMDRLDHWMRKQLDEGANGV